MSSDRDMTRVVRSWLRIDEAESADRVLDAVLDQLDTTPQRRATWWPARKLPQMSSYANLAMAAAAVLAIAFLGWQLLPGSGTGGPVGLPSPTATPTPPPSPSPTPGWPSGAL